MRPSNRQEQQSYVEIAPYEHDHVPPFHGSAGLAMHGMSRRTTVGTASAHKSNRYTLEEHAFQNRAARLTETSPVYARRQVNELADQMRYQ